MAKRLVKKKRHKRALKPALQAVKEDPEYADAYRVLAQIHTKMGDTDKAAEATKKANELDKARGVEPVAAPVAKEKKQSAAAKMLAEKMGTKGEAPAAGEKSAPAPAAKAKSE